MAIDATIGGENSNSYITLAEADAYLNEQRLWSSAWGSATGGDGDREAALQWASSLIDTYYHFKGTLVDVEQALRWPRYGAFDTDDRLISQEVIPEQVKRATAELAFELLRRDRSAQPTILGQGITEAKVGSLMVKVDDGEILDLVPASITALLAQVGSPSNAFNAGGKSYVVPVKRS